MRKVHNTQTNYCTLKAHNVTLYSSLLASWHSSHVTTYVFFLSRDDIYVTWQLVLNHNVMSMASCNAWCHVVNLLCWRHDIRVTWRRMTLWRNRWRPFDVKWWRHKQFHHHDNIIHNIKMFFSRNIIFAAFKNFFEIIFSSSLNSFDEKEENKKMRSL